MVADTTDVVNGALPGFEARGSDAPGPPRGRKRASEDGDPLDELSPPTPVSLLLACARVKSPAGQESPAIHLPLSAQRPERRVTPRHASIALSPAERTRLREMTARALGCRTTFVAMRKSKADGGHVDVDRLVMAVPCGTRMCEPCDAERRRKEAARVEGNWRTFWTLGVPSGFWRADVAWRLMGQWVKALFRELRRELAEGQGSRVKVGAHERERIGALNERRQSGKRKMALLQYAWCIEPHQSGWPHLHFVTNAHFIGFEWIKSLWGRITSTTIRWARVERVKDVDGVCRYLSKYISKTTFSPDITAIMYRRRQWASTVPAPPKRAAEWTVEERREGEDLFSETVFASVFAREKGWKVGLSRAGEYANFSRRFSREEYAIVEAERRYRSERERESVWLYDPVWDAHEALIKARGYRTKREVEKESEAKKWYKFVSLREILKKLLSGAAKNKAFAGLVGNLTREGGSW